MERKRTEAKGRCKPTLAVRQGHGCTQANSTCCERTNGQGKEPSERERATGVGGSGKIRPAAAVHFRGAPSTSVARNYLD